MEGEETLLDVINEEDEFEIMEDDVDMVDCEEGEIVVEDNDLRFGERQNGRGDEDQGIKGFLGKKKEQHQPNMNKNKKKKKKRKRKGPMNLDRCSMHIWCTDMRGHGSGYMSSWSFESCSNTAVTDGNSIVTLPLNVIDRYWTMR